MIIFARPTDEPMKVRYLGDPMVFLPPRVSGAVKTHLPGTVEDCPLCAHGEQPEGDKNA